MICILRMYISAQVIRLLEDAAERDKAASSTDSKAFCLAYFNCALAHKADNSLDKAKEFIKKAFKSANSALLENEKALDTCLASMSHSHTHGHGHKASRGRVDPEELREQRVELLIAKAQTHLAQGVFHSERKGAGSLEASRSELEQCKKVCGEAKEVMEHSPLLRMYLTGRHAFRKSHKLLFPKYFHPQDVLLTEQKADLELNKQNKHNTIFIKL